MKICVIGTGYVGLVAGVCLAETGNDVICTDSDKEKLEKLQQGIMPIYEPNLKELLLSNLKENRLVFTSDIDYAIKNSLVCFIAVGTPQTSNGSVELKYIYQAAKDIGKSINGYKVIVNKSTVPVGCTEEIGRIIKENTNIDFDIVSNPEFLKQGSAVNDFLKPDRIIIGSNSERAFEIIKEIYSPYLRTGNPVIETDIKSAELIKYASNSFLAMKISFINQISNIAASTGADIEMVRKGMCADKRIGNYFLFPGAGYGGSCFPKDVKALIKIAKENGCGCDLLEATDKINKNQRKIFLNKILKRFNNDISDKTLAIWGLAFKPDTNDVREAVSVYIIEELLNRGAKVNVYDPKAKDNARKIFRDKITYADSSYGALLNADCMLLLTEWREFRRPDFDKMKDLLKTPIIFDGRNQYNYNVLLDKGFEYYDIGRK